MAGEMRNILLTLRFDGTGYHGFQVQKNAVTVCAVFQDALEKTLGKRWDVKGCSRTDTGVHANCYCLSFQTDNAIPCEGLVRALNAALPDDIAVTGAQDMPLDFHARYHCTGKQYVYTIHNSAVKDPFHYRWTYRYSPPLNEKMLHQQAQAFVGTHDFAAFCTRGEEGADTVRTIAAFDVLREGERVFFRVSGDGFLYNMVRILVGTLVYISMGRIAPGSIPAILQSRDRSRAGKTMPAKGLALNEIYYPGMTCK
jgi:pseudouridylate synthase I